MYDQKWSCLGRCGVIVVLRSDPYSVVGFLISWKTNGKQMCSNESWLFCVVLWQGSDIYSFSEKTGDHLLAHLEIHMHSIVVNFGAHTHKSTIHHDVIDAFRSIAVVFFEYFLQQIITSLFYSNSLIMCE